MKISEDINTKTCSNKLCELSIVCGRFNIKSRYKFHPNWADKSIGEVISCDKILSK